MKSLPELATIAALVVLVLVPLVVDAYLYVQQRKSER
jgi:hypothetical protein